MYVPEYKGAALRVPNVLTTVAPFAKVILSALTVVLAKATPAKLIVKVPFTVIPVVGMTLEVIAVQPVSESVRCK